MREFKLECVTYYLDNGEERDSVAGIYGEFDTYGEALITAKAALTDHPDDWQDGWTALCGAPASCGGIERTESLVGEVNVYGPNEKLLYTDSITFEASDYFSDDEDEEDD